MSVSCDKTCEAMLFHSFYFTYCKQNKENNKQSQHLMDYVITCKTKYLYLQIPTREYIASRCCVDSKVYVFPTVRISNKKD